MNIEYIAQFALYEVLGNVAFYAPVVGISAYIGYKMANGLLKNVLGGKYGYIIAVVLSVIFIGVFKAMGFESDDASDVGSLATIIFYAFFLLLLGNVWRREQNKVETEAKTAPISPKRFGKLLTLLKTHIKTVVMFLVIVAIFIVAHSAYTYYRTTETHRLSCIESIHYKSSIDGGAYLIFWDKEYIKTQVYGRENIRRFGTQEEAMEYCLTFLEVETKKTNTSKKKQGLTLDEILNTR